MLCPIDKTELKIIDRQGVQIDVCPHCRGVWLDRGELDKIIEVAYAAPPDALCNDPKIPEFRRAASRLHEMQSPDYLNAPHAERG